MQDQLSLGELILGDVYLKAEMHVWLAEQGVHAADHLDALLTLDDLYQGGLAQFVTDAELESGA